MGMFFGGKIQLSVYRKRDIFLFHSDSRQYFNSYRLDVCEEFLREEKMSGVLAVGICLTRYGYWCSITNKQTKTETTPSLWFHSTTIKPINDVLSALIRNFRRTRRKCVICATTGTRYILKKIKISKCVRTLLYLTSRAICASLDGSIRTLETRSRSTCVKSQPLGWIIPQYKYEGYFLM